MSITAETAKQHANDPAVLCCRAEEGTVLEPANFEDPAIFPDLIDSGLLNTDGALKLGQVLNGSKLTKTVDSLTPITPDIVDKYDAAEEEAAEEEAPAEEAAAEVAAPVAAAAPVAVAGGTIKLHIGEGKNIDIEIPAGVGAGAAAPAEAAVVAPVAAAAPAAAAEEEEVVVREMTRKHYKIDKVVLGDETKIEGTTLYVREAAATEGAEAQALVQSMKVEIINPDQYHTYSQTVMDIQPIACKADTDMELGEGETMVLDGVVTVVTGVTEEGVQVGEFGSSEGYLDENMQWGYRQKEEHGETGTYRNPHCS